jgi:hypothetical protein
VSEEVGGAVRGAGDAADAVGAVGSAVRGAGDAVGGAGEGVQWLSGEEGRAWLGYRRMRAA